MSVGAVFFSACAIAALLGALWTVLAQNPIRSALGLLTTIFGIAGLFLKLSAQFLAAIQLIVYAGAVVVLFVFVIMVLGPDAVGTNGTKDRAKATISRGIAGALFALLAGAALVSLVGSPATRTVLGPATLGHGSVEAVGGRLFAEGLVPFELATALLIVAVIGAIAVAKGRHPTKSAEPDSTDARSYFHGPLLERDDRGRPPAEPAPPSAGHGHGGGHA